MKMDRTQLIIGIVIIAGLCLVGYVAQPSTDQGNPPSNGIVTPSNVTTINGYVISANSEIIEVPRENHQNPPTAVTIEPDT